MHYFRYLSATVIVLMIENCLTNEKACPILEHTTHINISNVLGNWYAVRGIEHTNVQNKSRQGTRKDCNSMTISQNDKSEITLQWSKNNEVKCKVNNNSPNLWETTDSTTNAPRTFQVTEVDDKHIILTTCTPSNRLSSAVLHRESTFIEEKVLAATNKLTKQNLQIVEVFDRCQI